MMLQSPLPSASATSDRNVETWDVLAGSVSSTFPLGALNLKQVADSGGRVLDYGCGDGRVLQVLHHLGASRLDGCDSSARMCRLASLAVPAARIFRVAKPIEPDLEDLAYDWVLVVGVFSSVIGSSHRRELLRRLHSSLADCGMLRIADFGRSRRQPYPDRYENPVIEPFTFRTAEGVLIHHFSLDELVELAQNVGRVQEAAATEAVSIHGNSLPGYVITLSR